MCGMAQTNVYVNCQYSLSLLSHHTAAASGICLCLPFHVLKLLHVHLPVIAT